MGAPEGNFLKMHTQQQQLKGKNISRITTISW